MYPRIGELQGKWEFSPIFTSPFEFSWMYFLPVSQPDRDCSVPRRSSIGESDLFTVKLAGTITMGDGKQE